MKVVYPRTNLFSPPSSPIGIAITMSSRRHPPLEQWMKDTASTQLSQWSVYNPVLDSQTITITHVHIPCNVTGHLESCTTNHHPPLPSPLLSSPPLHSVTSGEEIQAQLKNTLRGPGWHYCEWEGLCVLYVMFSVCVWCNCVVFSLEQNWKEVLPAQWQGFFFLLSLVCPSYPLVHCLCIFVPT